jgi:hypothetical protein
VSSRQKISEKLLADLAVVWETHGASVLERLAKEEPGKLATIAYGLLPRDIFVRVESEDPLRSMDGEDLAALQHLIAAIRAAGVAVLPSAEVMTAVTEDLRARLAKPVG